MRNNSGGHVSALLLERLARRRTGYAVTRWFGLAPWPEDSPAGPMVALTDENPASDGDIFSHNFKLMKLGPLVGKRTWEGVVGIRPRRRFVDGGVTTLPDETRNWIGQQRRSKNSLPSSRPSSRT